MDSTTHGSPRTPLLLVAVALAGLATVMGCSASGFGGDLGVTPGGAQDIRYARDIIEGGGIPDFDAFTAEGLFSEHDLPFTKAPACTQVLCPTATASTITPLDGPGLEAPGGEQVLVQLGFKTKHDESFQRRPLNLSLAVDISGSMSGGKLDALKVALEVMTAQLDEGDVVSLVAFDDRADLRMGPTVMDAGGRAKLLDRVRALEPSGGTDIESGLALSYEQVLPDAGGPGVEDRVMLMTDARPNIGATDKDSFLGMARLYSESGVGISVFGVGLDLGNELATSISEVRGGNYFYLADNDAIAQVFDEEFDYIVTPLAYQLEVDVTAVEGWHFERAFGAPLDQPSSTQIEFGASTLFLSKRGGGIGVVLVPDGDGAVVPEQVAELAEFVVRYEPVGEAPVASVVSIPFEGGSAYETPWSAADDLGVSKLGVLIDEYTAMLMGAEFCAGALMQDVAVDRIEQAALRLDHHATMLSDAALADERALMETLADNVAGGAANCRSSSSDGY